MPKVVNSMMMLTTSKTVLTSVLIPLLRHRLMQRVVSLMTTRTVLPIVRITARIQLKVLLSMQWVVS